MSDYLCRIKKYGYPAIVYIFLGLAIGVKMAVVEGYLNSSPDYN